MALTGSLCIAKLSPWALPGKVISRGFISMSLPNHSSRLAVIVFGVFFGSILGVIAGFALTVWTFQGVGAAQGFADDPNWVPFTLLFFCFFGVLIGGSIGGFAGYKAAGADGATSGKKLNPIDELA
jgi:hypothetical protein